MATIGVNIINFKAKYTGLVSAILLLFYGISGSIFSQIYSNFYVDVSNGQENTGGFLLFLCISTVVTNFICTFMMFTVPVAVEKALLSDAGEKKAEEPAPESIKAVQLTQNDDDMDIPLIDRNSPTKPYIQSDPENPEPAAPQDNSMSPTQILASGIFWLFTLTYVLQQGLTYVSNVSTIIESIEGPQANPINVAKSGADHVTLISVAQSASRFLFAILSDIIGDKLGLDRSFLLVVSELCLLLPMLTLAIGTDAVDVGINLMWMCSIFIGVGWGAAGALFPPLTKDFFGNLFKLVLTKRHKMVWNRMWFRHVWCSHWDCLFKSNFWYFL